jgi:hypothetical protein
MKLKPLDENGPALAAGHRAVEIRGDVRCAVAPGIEQRDAVITFQPPDLPLQLLVDLKRDDVLFTQL